MIDLIIEIFLLVFVFLIFLITLPITIIEFLLWRDRVRRRDNG